MKITWNHDSSEGEVSLSECRLKVEAASPPSRLLVLGQRRPRLVLEVRLLFRMDQKAPGYVASLGKSSFDGPVGLSILDLKADAVGKLIGKQAAMKMRMERICGCTVEFMGKDTDSKQAFIVGTSEERARAQALIQLLETAVDFRVKATELPLALKELSSSLVVPGSASNAISAKLELQKLQDSTDTLIVALAKPSKLEVRERKELVTQQVVECKLRGQWVEATILEITTFNAESDEEDDTDGRTMKAGRESESMFSAKSFSFFFFPLSEAFCSPRGPLQRWQRGFSPGVQRAGALGWRGRCRARAPGAAGGPARLAGHRQ